MESDWPKGRQARQSLRAVREGKLFKILRSFQLQQVKWNLGGKHSLHLSGFSALGSPYDTSSPFFLGHCICSFCRQPLVFPGVLGRSILGAGFAKHMQLFLDWSKCSVWLTTKLDVFHLCIRPLLKFFFGGLGLCWGITSSLRVMCAMLYSTWQGLDLLRRASSLMQSSGIPGGRTKQ